MATAERKYKPKAHIILDLECLSLDSHAAIVHIGAVAQLGNGLNSFKDQFEAKIRPSEYESLNQFTVDQATKDFHERENPGYLAQLDIDGISLAEAMLKLTDWARQFTGDHELHVWTQGKDYDYPIMKFAADNTGVALPWPFRNVHCLRDLVFLNPGARMNRKAGEKVAHTALQDAIWAQQQFMAVIGNSAWYQRLMN